MSKPEDIQCPVCGYYCLGKGGHGCIDKPSVIAALKPIEMNNDIVDKVAKKLIIYEDIDMPYRERAKQIISIPEIYIKVPCLECKGVVDELFCSQCGDLKCEHRSEHESNGCCDATCKKCKGEGFVFIQGSEL